MKIVKSLSCYMALLVGVLLMGGCASDTVGDSEQPLPDGKGRIRITISTPENTPAATRAVRQPNAWQDPDHEWEKLQTFRILICTGQNNQVVDIISGTKTSPTPDANGRWTVTSSPLTPGNYRIYATANYDDGYTVGSTIYDFQTVQLTTFNGYSEQNIPMTGKLYDVYPTPKTVTVTDGTETDAGTITVWRTVGKLEFDFVNETSEQVKVTGIEVEPINQASAADKGIFLFSRDNLWSETNLKPSEAETITMPTGANTDVGPVAYTPTTALTLDAKGGTTPTGKLFFYVNETNATFTTTQNQLSLRIKVQRWNATTSSWRDEELRYGVTTPYTDGTAGGNGFNVIRRNDWIHIPIHLTDWQFRVEPLAFVPIAGYPATTLSSDALTTTFSTGGYIILQPFAQKNNDGTWRDFTDPEVNFQSLTWKNSDGTDVAGTGKIFETAPTYDTTTGRIVAVLNNSLPAGTYMTTITVNVKLGPTGTQYEHAFTFNVILQK